ncbi:MAG: hypothetical protein LUG51_14565, partial [Tannerellaceae bacterium]|nr:hypothetical protein [Tannerellaceae bacterium]
KPLQGYRIMILNPGARFARPWAIAETPSGLFTDLPAMTDYQSSHTAIRNNFFGVMLHILKTK